MLEAKQSKLLYCKIDGISSLAWDFSIKGAYLGYLQISVALKYEMYACSYHSGCACFHFFHFCVLYDLMIDSVVQVLPSLREKHDEFMLKELVRRWSNHKVMVRWLSRFFHYLDRYFIARRSLPPLNEVGLACFRDLVFYDCT